MYVMALKNHRHMEAGILLNESITGVVCPGSAELGQPSKGMMPKNKAPKQFHFGEAFCSGQSNLIWTVLMLR